MTPEAAIYQFLSGFGIPAYTSTSVPDDAAYPYLTYDLVIGGEWNSGEVSMPVNVWYRTESEAAPNSKVRQMGAALHGGGVQVPCDGGVLWIKKGSPWAQAVREEGDNMVKRRYVNLDIEYLLTSY